MGLIIFLESCFVLMRCTFHVTISHAPADVVVAVVKILEGEIFR